MAAPHELLKSGDLPAAASALLHERGRLAQFPEIGGALQEALARSDLPRLAGALATYLLLVDDHESAAIAYSLGLPPSPKRLLETCRIVADPEQCYPLEKLTPEREQTYWRAATGVGARPDPSLGVPRIARLEEGSLWGLTFLPVTADRKLSAPSFLHSRRPLKALWREGMETIPVATAGAVMGCFSGVDRFGEAVLIGNIDNFGHWLLNHVARLAVVEASSRDLSTLPLVVGENLDPRQREWLERLGYPESRLIRVRKGRLSRFDVLWAPMMPFCAWAWSPAILDWLRERFIETSARSNRRRIYLTRRNARWRRLLNENALAPLLSEWGFETIDPGGLSMDEQLRLASEAEVIAGTMGAGMYLHIFAPRDARIIQLGYRRDNPQEADFVPFLAERLGQPFEAALGTAIIPTVRANHLNYDFTLPPEEFRDALQRAGISRRA